MFSAITNFLQPYLLAIAVGLLLTFGAYFTYSQWKIGDLNQQLVSKDITIQTQELALKQANMDVEKIKEINSDISEQIDEGKAAEDILEEKLQDIGNLATNSPSEIELKINEAANNRNRCFEIATGAEPLKKETNVVCPHLFLK